MNKIIPLSFIRERTQLSWREAAFGYQKQWLGWNSVVDLACDRLTEGEDRPLVVELAGLSKNETHCIAVLLDKLAQNSEIDDSPSDAKWLYLRLAWLFENREAVDDALQEVEIIYADFDYPEDVAPFVRYMPVTDSYNTSAHSPEENHARLLAKWKSYLDREATSYHKKSY